MKRWFILVVVAAACSADGAGRQTLDPSDLEIGSVGCCSLPTLTVS